jgi:Coenzyme PQQ synthesis protein D (PqqD)
LGVGRANYDMQLAHEQLLVLVPQINLDRIYSTTPLAASEPVAQLEDLALALSISPWWTKMRRVVLVARPSPDPLLGIIGYFDAADRARLEGLRSELTRALPHLLYVDYARAEKACEQLAAQLLERFGKDELSSFRFTAIPRGGYVVLGMLAYILHLNHPQLQPPHPPDTPLVVVDDCAGAGIRFAQFLDRVESQQIVFAHLYSHPDLRDAIETREPRVVACLSAHDLQDHASDVYGHEYHAWRKLWGARLDPRAYWVGQSDHVCFAWNEPDTAFWNPVTDRVEPGWALMSPKLCLKNRPAPGTKPIQVQVQPEGKGPLKPASHTLFGALEGQIVLGELKTEESFVLDGVGADMWRAIVEYGNLEEAAAALVEGYEVDSTTLQEDLRAFVENLLFRGLLEKEG